MDIKRSRPTGEIIFPTPLTGTTGARLISYVWQWQELADKKISDWERSVINKKTGREIVHQFNVDGEYVSAESAMKLLGFMGDNAKVFKSLKSTARTLAKLRLELYMLENEEKEWDIAWAMVCAIELPPIEEGEWFVEYGTKRRILKMGNIEETQIHQEYEWATSCLVKHFRAAKMSELGWDKYMFKSELNARYHFRYTREDLCKRIKRAEDRLRTATAGA